MDFREILELVGMVVGTAALGLLFYFYFTKAEVKLWVDRILKKLPVAALLSFAASKVEDKEGEFDVHDALVVSAHLADFLKVTITDTSNIRFQDVEEETFEFLRVELNRYRDLGVRGVPDISDQVLKTNVEIVFDRIVRILREDSAGNDS